MTLVDTSSWIHQLRRDGDVAIRRRVETLLMAGDACWCSMVRVELWIGARGRRERSILRTYEGVLPEIEITAGVWNDACSLAQQARALGLTCPAPDVIIVACARHHRCGLETADHHCAALMAV